jgi:hypothetical protein
MAYFIHNLPKVRSDGRLRDRYDLSLSLKWDVMLNFFRRVEWPFTEYPRICIFPFRSDPIGIPPEIR